MKLIQFTADWCGPCKMMKPKIEQLKEEMGDRMVLEVINVDENAAATEAYNVKNIPTFIFETNGEIVERLIGAQQVSTFKEVIEFYESKN
jgi:thioredoxin 1